MSLKFPKIALNQILFILTMIGIVIAGLGAYQIINVTAQPSELSPSTKALKLESGLFDKIIEAQKSDITITKTGNIGRDNPFDTAQ